MSNVTAASHYEQILGFIALSVMSVFFGIVAAVVCRAKNICAIQDKHTEEKQIKIRC